MKKNGSLVDSNHVKKTTEITADKKGPESTTPQKPQYTADIGKETPRFLSARERILKGQSHTSSISDATDVVIPGTVSRILANVSNPEVEKGNGKSPICLVTRSPKTRTKAFSLKQTGDSDEFSLEKKEITSKIAGGCHNPIHHDFHYDKSESGKTKAADDTTPKIYNRSPRAFTLVSGQDVQNQTTVIGLNHNTDPCDQSQTSEDYLSKGATQLGVEGQGDDGKNDNPCIQMDIQGDLKGEGETIAKSSCDERGYSLAAGNNSYLSLGTKEGKYKRMEDRSQTYCPSLPLSLSKDSGISSPSVDEVKIIDQRGETTKDNDNDTDPTRASKLERGEKSKTHCDEQEYSHITRGNIERDIEEGKKEEIVKKSSKTNNEISSTDSSPDSPSPQSKGGTICPQSYLSSYLPSSTPSKTETISLQDESNPLDSPLPPPVVQIEKHRVTSSRIDARNTHASMESSLASSDQCDYLTATSVSTTFVNSTTAPHPNFVTETTVKNDISTNADGRVKGGCDVKTSNASVLSTDQIVSTDSCSDVDEVKASTDFSTNIQTNVISVDTLTSSTESTITTISTSVVTTATTSLTGEVTTEIISTPTTISSPIPTTSSSFSLSSSLETSNISNQQTDLPNDQSQNQDYQNSEQSNLSESNHVNCSQEQERDHQKSQVKIEQSHNSECIVSGNDIRNGQVLGPLNGSCRHKEISVDIEIPQQIQHSIHSSDNKTSVAVNEITASDKQIKNTDTIVPIDSEAADTVPPLKPKRAKLTFKDINIQDVISLNSDSPGQKLKGILKSSSNESIVSPGVVFPKNSQDKLHSARSVSFKKTHTKNTFSYYNAAFEGEIREEPSRRPSLADVVSHIMRTNSVVDIEEEDDNSHPYGRDNSLTDLINGKRRETFNMDAGKLIVWLALAIMIVSLAGGIIFMSETYNLNHGEEVIIVAPEDDTTLSHS